jgi:hypothetical protein
MWDLIIGWGLIWASIIVLLLVLWSAVYGKGQD